ncbi:MAG TPA: hypothetical protein VJA45_07985 [Methylomirabilota bacterium]|nr:hypothetical protein [Methylomirabilota bacterium]
MNPFRFALAITLALLAGPAAPPAWAQPALPLPAHLPAEQRARIDGIVKHAFVSTKVEGEPYAVRPEVFEYLLDHPEFASHVTRALRAARYKIWTETDGLWLDDGWGIRGRFEVMHAERGLRLMYARGAYEQAMLPDVRGQAVVALTYGFRPDGKGNMLAATMVTSFLELDSRVLHGLGKVGGPLVQAKADREGRTLLKVFARVSRAIEANPVDAYQRVSARPDVPKPELEEFRRLLRLP